ncbi:MAG TPA: proton-translocating transhydrogenase family protein [Alphaproteobacteria bacterium]|nr:proton-translocating transhydrogenase family protein [Alphaproteobacteria bacterium]
MDLMMLLTVFVLAGFVGYFVVWGVTPALHTPLMAVTNAISGIVVVAAIMVAGVPQGSIAAKVVGGVAILLCSINIFGGFAITRRMLAMFKSKGAK